MLDKLVFPAQYFLCQKAFYFRPPYFANNSRSLAAIADFSCGSRQVWYA
jgi:hypothetical protein